MGGQHGGPRRSTGSCGNRGRNNSLSLGVSEGFAEGGTCESEEVSVYKRKRREGNPGRDEAMCKGPESCVSLACPEQGKENPQGMGQVAGPEGWQDRWIQTVGGLAPHPGILGPQTWPVGSEEPTNTKLTWHRFLWVFNLVFLSFSLREKNHTSPVCHVLQYFSLSFRNAIVEDWD